MKRLSWKALVIMTAALIALVAFSVRELDAYLDRKAWEEAADIVYPMANQNITWTGAGYSGIYAGGAGR